MKGKPQRWLSEPEQWWRLRERVREFRKEPTLAEEKLWQALRSRRLGGAKFRQQHTIGPHVVDFYFASAKLVVEVDGAVHQKTTERDAVRETYLKSRGLQVVRLLNDDVLSEWEDVLKKLAGLLGEDR